MGLKDDIKQPLVRSSPFQAEGCRPKLCVLRNAPCLLHSLVEETLLNCQGKKQQQKKPFTEIEWPAPRKKRQAEYLPSAIKSCSLHRAAGALPSGGIKEPQAARVPVACCSLFRGAVRLN